MASSYQNEQGEDINAIAAKVGVDGSAVTTSHDYKIAAVESRATAVEAEVDTLNATVGTDGDHSMARQAIINGNFDICQRRNSGTTNPATGSFIADRWKITAVADGYTAPTLIHSLQTLTPGDIPNSMAFYRVNANGAGSGLGEESDYCLDQYIEHGTRLLCGENKYVTLSFYARSSIANKRIGVCLIQNYGSGGSPSAVEIVNGDNFTLTSSWAKYVVTFETNTLTGKTFGSSTPDFISPRFQYAWGGDYMGRFKSLTAEDFVGSGNIDITQVQLCSGSVALPFQPKRWADEYRYCLRYYQTSYAYGVAPGTATNTGLVRFAGSTDSGNSLAVHIPLPVTMRDTPTVSIYDAGGTADVWSYARNGATGSVAVTWDICSHKNLSGYLNAGAAWVVGNIQGHWVASAEF